MKVNFNYNTLKVSNVAKPQNTVNYIKSNEPDKFELTTKTNYRPNYKILKNGNTISFISFKALQDPTVIKNPSIRTGVEDSKSYKENIKLSKSLPRGENLKFSVPNSNGNIEIAMPDGKVLGHLPNSINNAIGSFIKNNPSDFSFKLYGTTDTNEKNTANALIDIEYLGENKAEVQQKLNALLYKNSITPEQVLHRILDYKKVLNGEEIGSQKIIEAQTAIDTITKAINDPKNQKILLIGHNKPDGDTVGSCMGLKAALDYMGKEKVDVAIDDVLAGFLRNVVDANEIKKSPTFLKELNSGIDSKIQEMDTDEPSLDNLSEIYSLQKVKKYYAQNVQTLNNKEKYDLAIFLDVPTPTKVSPAIKEYAKNAKNIIYIDHHPFQKGEWAKEQTNNGVNIDSIKKEHMFWSEPKVPANTMLVTILVDKLLPGLTDKFRDSFYKNDISDKDKDLIKKISTSLVVGTITDTSGFRRNMNKSIEDEMLTSNKKTGFAPAGLSDWLLNLTNGDVTRRSIKKQMKYAMPNKVDLYFPQDFVDFYNTEKAMDESLNSTLPNIDNVMKHNTDDNYKKIAAEVAKDTVVYPELGLGISKIHFTSMKHFLKEYNMNNPEINMRDIIGAYKYNPTTIALKYSSKDSTYKVAPKYEKNKISVMIREEEVKNELNANFQISKENSLGFSFRSQDGTNYAGILATLFGGGGHASASGASLSLPELTAESKLIVKINGKVENDINKIYKTIKKNYENNYFNLTETNAKIEIQTSDDGISINELMSNLTAEIRQNS